MPPRCQIIVILVLFTYILTFVNKVLAKKKEPSWKDCEIVRQRGRLSMVTMVDCTHMGFKTVPKDALDFTGADYIKLGNNPYICDCEMEWFRAKLEDSPKTSLYKIFDTRNLKCAAPKQRKGKKISFLYKNLCPPKEPRWKDCKQISIINMLDCSDHEFESIPKDIFSQPFGEMFLSGNPYKCSCDMRWFIQKLRLKDVRKKIADDTLMKCAKPPRLVTKEIVKLTEQDVCPSLYKDFDECKENKHDCDKNAKCIDHNKGFSCLCKTGFVGNGKKCADINECLKVRCPQNSKCLNTEGSFECVCDEGFKMLATKCVDIDECVDKTTKCSKYAECKNTVGSYKWICKQGYISRYDGKVCDKKVEISCTTKPSPCKQVNEICIDNIKNNTFKCLCRPGFHRKFGGSCDDIDECKVEGRCAENSECINTFGSFKCLCKKGFVHKGKLCVDIDECSSGKHDCHRDAVCINNIGGYKCQCKAGFEQLKDGRLCMRKEQPSLSNSINFNLVALASAMVFVILMAITFIVYIRKNKKEKPQTFSQPEKQQQEQLFIFNSPLPDPLMMNISLNESAITQWSEESSYSTTDGEEPSSTSLASDSDGSNSSPGCDESSGLSENRSTVTAAYNSID